MNRRAIVTLGVGVFYLLMSLPDFDLMDADFRCFYESAVAWRNGGNMYAETFRVNLTPPWFAVAISPLVPLGLPMAFAVWTVMSVVFAADSVRIILKGRPTLIQHWPLVVVGGLMLLPAWYTWRHGQVTWLLCWCMTRAWRSRSRIRSGVWLAPLVMLKPPFLVMALLLPWPIPLVTLSVSAFATTVLIGLIGSRQWIDWWNLGQQVSWIGLPSNASLWGWATRLQFGTFDGTRVTDLSLASIATIGAIGAVLIVFAYRARADRRWTLAFLTALLLSPLGWTSYLVIALGPIVATTLPRLTWLTVAVGAAYLLPRQIFVILVAGGLPFVTAYVQGLAALGLTLDQIRRPDH